MSLLLWLTASLAIASILATCVVLVFAALVYRNPTTRPELRRQSLVMLLVVLIVSIFYSLGTITNRIFPNYSTLCTVSIMAMLFITNFQHFVIMLIAVNLQLTVVHNISTVGWTPYYLGGSLIAALITIVPGTVAKIWGHDPVIGLCYMIMRDPRERLSWSLGSLHIWTLLSAAISLCSTIAVLIKLVVTSQKVNKAFGGSRKSDNVVLSQQSILRSVTLRILPHPVYLVFSNIITVVLDLHMSLNHYNETLEVFFLIFYETPPLFFACVILFFDPSLSTAIRQLLRKTPTILGVTYTNPQNSFENTPIGLPSTTESCPSSTSLVQAETNAEQGVLKRSSKPTGSYASIDAADVKLPPNSSTTPRRQVSIFQATESISTLQADQTHSTTRTTMSRNMDFHAL